MDRREETSGEGRIWTGITIESTVESLPSRTPLDKAANDSRSSDNCPLKFMF